MKKILALTLAISCATAGAFENIKPSEEDLTWLAKNVYFEARNQPAAGRMAVMMVTLNRVVSDKFPNTIKNVVTQGGVRRHRCQFSWYCDGKSDNIRDWETFNEIKYMISALLPYVSPTLDITSGSLYYHATYVTPNWSTKMKKIIQIGDHIFYKEK